MTRIRVVLSQHLDPDVEAHLSLLERLPRVELVKSPRRLENQLALIVRAACRIWSGSSEADIVVTVGEPALTAALLGWRGPLVHLPVGRLTESECRLLRWRGQHARFAEVFSSHLAATDALARGLSSETTRVIRTAALPALASREEIRRKLRIGPDATCVLLNGRINKVGGHRTALITSAVLAFRDPTWHILIDAGEQSDYVNRFFASTSQPQTLVLGGGYSPSELAAAADVMVVDDHAIPSVAGIASAASARVPVVASARTWRQEQLMHVPAMLMTSTAQRYWARAVLQSVDGQQKHDMDRLSTSMATSVSEQTLRHQWLEVLHTVCGRTHQGLVPSAPLQASP